MKNKSDLFPQELIFFSKKNNKRVVMLLKKTHTSEVHVLLRKSSPITNQPLRATDGDRSSFYTPEVMARRPLSVSPTSQHTTTTTHIHYGTPKTQGTLSPSLRGVPTSANYGTGHHVSSGAPSSGGTVTARPVHVQHESNPPPVPTNPPPESRVPPSIRSAVSPKRPEQSPIQWPPPQRIPILRYWRINPASRKEKNNEHVSLHDMIAAADREMLKHSRTSRMPEKVDEVFHIARSKTRKNSIWIDDVEPNSAISVVIDSESKTESSASISVSDHKVENETGGAVLNEQENSELKIQSVIEQCEANRQKNLKASSKTRLSITNLNDSMSNEVETQECCEAFSSLKVPKTTIDCSTSPIPTIELPRRRTTIIESVARVETHAPLPSNMSCSRKSTERFGYGVDAPSPEYPAVLVGINTTPRRLLTHNSSSPHLVEMESSEVKPKKKVDFSSAEVIPSVWDDRLEVNEDVDMLTQRSSTSPELTNPDTNINTPYDGDESETYENKSDIASSVETDVINEKEEWMKEELELAKKEELTEMSDLLKADPDEKEEWRRQAMALLTDDSQTERDLEMVAALYERLEGLKDLHEIDKQRAIDCIEKHQRNLQGQQVQLSALLSNAIEFLKNLDTNESSSVSTAAEQHSSIDPSSRQSPSEELKNLSPCVDEMVSNRQRFYSPGDFISELLNRITANDGQSYSRTTFEQRVVTERESPHGGKPIESRGQHGSLNNPSGRIPYCEACKQQIRGAFVLATGLTWCPEHFVCAYRGCGRRLLECGFVEEQGSKYCESCFEAHIAPRCAKCSKPIVAFFFHDATIFLRTFDRSSIDDKQFCNCREYNRKLKTRSLNPISLRFFHSRQSYEDR
ncbi:LIM domain protein [Dictyocaulus viviparus]|uniref:LIM domain protein n=1 Tax=Dictyocaulus viviparus TaxID=29172 RepID=A0A0D8XKS7_DICVI|nr:LIM domain protein [Dictyocaulus viviparus]